MSLDLFVGDLSLELSNKKGLFLELCNDIDLTPVR
jgi:hypothetical protein